MGFNEVYKSLQELFPQIDGRVLRAVSIEHSKDVDAAVETVLEEIIPFFTERSKTSSPLTGNLSVGEPSTVQNGCDVNGGSRESLNNSDGADNEPFRDAYDGNYIGESNGKGSESVLAEQIRESNIKVSVDVHSHGEPLVLVDQSGGNTLQIEVSGDPESCIETSSNTTFHALVSSKQRDIDINLNDENEDFDDCLENDFGVSINQKNDQAKASADAKTEDCPASLTIHDLTLSTSSVEFVTCSDMHSSNLEDMEVSLFSDTSSKKDSPANIVQSENDSTLSDTLSQSKQIHSMEVLEEIIADARNNKKTLFSVMESIIGLMREVEIKEQEAELAKVAAAMGGDDTRHKVGELHKMLQRAKAGNDMHAGEVHGEKAILATELRELQSRVVSLSDERDKSLAVLDEMRQTLEIRLIAAENEIISAEEEKVESEKSARKVLANQELIMEKVVQESNILKKQAEDNAKLQEFLLNRGRVVDMLQGEIAVICQDVRLLKEKFDENVLFSKSVSSSQTSCILASSGSSLRSSITEQVEPVPDQVGSSEPQNKDPFECFEQDVFEDETARDDRKALTEDGWDLFDDEFRRLST